MLSIGLVAGSLGVGLIHHPRRQYLVAGALAFGAFLAATAGDTRYRHRLPDAPGDWGDRLLLRDPQVEQRRIWPWHYQEVYVTGIDRVTTGNRTEHTHLTQATTRRRREDLTPNRVERVKIWSLLVLWLC